MARQPNHKPDHFQQQAIDSTARGIRIVAPAGSGKSETLARRVAKRIEKDGIDPRRILVLTFDNAAKKSLSGFFGDLLDRRHMPQIRTFNAHGNKILEEYFREEKHSLAGNIPSQDVRQTRNKFDARGLELPVLTWDGVARKLTEVFGALKEQGFYPGKTGERDKQTLWLRDDYFRLPREGESASLEDFWGMPSNTPADDTYVSQLGTVLDSFNEFDAAMRQLEAMDFVDQKSRAVYQLWKSRAICELLQSQFDEIVVDECQDISRLDAMLVYYSAGPGTLVVLAGDDDQTLYEWRNAHSLYLRHPQIVFKDIEFETIHLDLNYRSPQAILGPAVQLISNNVERIEKSPSSGVMEPGSLKVMASPSQKEHDRQLLTEIRRELDSGRPPEDIAILCHHRDDRLLKKPIEEMLLREGVPLAETDRNEQITKPGVLVRSFLKAKGRQWPVVMIPNANDRDVPDAESVRKGEVESIRRRFYVAMTRASEKLVLGYVRGGDDDHLYATAEGETIGTNGASRFLFEAGVVTAPNRQEEIIVEEVVPIAEQSHSVPESVQDHAPASAEAHVPSPALAEATPVRKRGKLKDWEPRQTDTRRIEKAQDEWAKADHDDAIRNAWKPIESTMKRMVKSPALGRTPSMKDVIDEAVVLRVVDYSWRDRLQMWRRVRNHAEHDLFALGQQTMNLESYKDHGFQLVHEVSEFFVHLADRHAPKQLALETQDDFLRRLSILVTQIQQGKASPITGRPLRALRFHPENNQYDVLAMQLLMVLRDVRFYIPEEFRWSSSPLVSKFTVDAVGHLPNGFRTNQTNRLRMDAGEEMNQLMSRFDRMVRQECEDDNPGRFLIDRLTDGLALENGNFHAGLKLNPRVRV